MEKQARVGATGSLDANVILRVIIGDVPAQTAKALALVERSKKLHIADIAMVETIFALERYYEIGREEISGIVGTFLVNPKIEINRALFAAALGLYVAHPKLSIEDCCLVTYAKLLGASPLWTFDRKLAGQSRGQARLL